MNKKGSITLMCVVLISMMMVTVGAMSKLVTIRAKTEHVKKSTVNSYHLAESAVELFVDRLNQLIEEAHPQVINTLKQEVKKQTNTHLIDNEWVKMKYIYLIYEVLLEEYCYKLGDEYRAKTIRYEVKTEGDGENYRTQIKIIPYLNVRGFFDQERNKELIDVTLLLKLKDYDGYRENELIKIYNEVFKKTNVERYKDLISVKVEVETLSEGRKIYNVEKIIAKIKAVGLSELEYKIVDKFREQHPINNVNQVFDLHMIGVPLSVKVGSIKTDDSNKK